MPRFAVDIRDERRQLLFKVDIVMGAAEPALITELVEGNAADGARALVELGQFLRGLAELKLFREDIRQRRGNRRSPGVTVHQVTLRAALTQMQLLRLRAGQLSDMKGRRLFALLAFHRPATLRCPDANRSLPLDRPTNDRLTASCFAARDKSQFEIGRAHV